MADDDGEIFGDGAAAGSAAATGTRPFANSLLDLRGIAKPTLFKGSEKEWPEWSFKFESWAALLGMERFMLIAEAQETPISMDGEKAEVVQMSRTLYHVLVQSCEGRALGVVKSSPRFNGLETWRLLKREFEPPLPGRHTALLQGLLTPSWNASKPIMPQVEEWERSVSRYEQQSGDKLSDAIRIAVLLKHLPSKLQEPLRLLQVGDANYTRLRQSIKAYVSAGVQYDASGIPVGDDPMDVGFVGSQGSGKSYPKSRGKGNWQKPAGKGAGKSSDRRESDQKDSRGQKTVGPCYVCGKMGHIAKDCYSSPVAKSKGKGKSSGGKGQHKGLLALTDDAQDPHEINGLWVMPLLSSVSEPESILVDSGAFDHCCGEAFCDHLPLEPVETHSRIFAANGAELTPAGRRRVRFQVESSVGPMPLEVSFVVIPSLRKTLLSVSKLTASGYNVLFRGNGQAQINRDGIALTLSSIKGMFHLPVTISRKGLVTPSPSKGETAPAKLNSVRFLAPVDGEQVPEVPVDLEALPYQGADNPEDLEDEAQRPVGVRIPKPPSAQAIQEHQLTHTPFREWCTHCIAGKARDANSERKPRDRDRVPQVQLDYAFLRTDSESDEKITVLLGYCLETSHALSVRVDSKGHDPAAVAAVLAFLTEVGLNSGPLEIHTDSEPSICALAKDVADKRPHTLLRKGPPGHHQSQGAVERYARTYAGQCRTFRLALEAKLGEKVSATSEWMDWVIRHVSFVHNHFHVRPCGRTPFQLLHNVVYSGKLLEFGELCHVRLPDALNQGKLEPRWAQGAWLGRSVQDGTHIVGTPHGVVNSRTVKRQSEGGSEIPTTVYKELILTKRGKERSELPNLPVVIPAVLDKVSVPQLPPEPIFPDPDVPAAGEPLPGGFMRLVQGAREKYAATSAAQASTDLTPKRPFDGDGGNPAAKARVSPSQPSKRPPEATSAIETRPQVKAKSSPPVPSPSVQEAMGEGGEAVEMETDTGGLDSLLQILAESEVSEEPWEDVQENRSVEIDSSVELSEAVLCGLDKEAVLAAMQRELDSLNHFQVFATVPLSSVPPNSRIISTRWVITVKPCGTVKARLVARDVNNGTWQDTFSSTPSSTGLRCALALAAHRGWSVVTGDLTTAFLHATIPEGEAVYVRAAHPLHQAGTCWQLQRALYGLRQAPRLFQEWLSDQFAELGLVRCKADPSLFVASNGSLVVSCHVDDPLIAGERDACDHFCSELGKRVAFKKGTFWDSTSWARYLGREWQRLPDGRKGFVCRNPPKYYDDLFTLVGMNRCNSLNTPGVVQKPADEQYVGEDLHKLFRTAVGKLQWAADARPDVLFALKELSRCLV